MGPLYSPSWDCDVYEEPSSLHTGKQTSVKWRAVSEHPLTKGLSHVLFMFLVLLAQLTVYLCTHGSRIELWHTHRHTISSCVTLALEMISIVRAWVLLNLPHFLIQGD